MAVAVVAAVVVIVTPPLLQSNPRRLWSLMAVDLVVGLAVEETTPLQIVSLRLVSGCSMAIA